MGPEVAAEAVGGQGEIVVEADGQAPIARVLLGAGELQIDLPLQVLVEEDTAPVFLAEGRGFGAARVLVGRGPLGPEPDVGVEAVQVLIERAVGGEVFEECAFAATESDSDFSWTPPILAPKPIWHSRRAASPVTGALTRRNQVKPAEKSALVAWSSPARVSAKA